MPKFSLLSIWYLAKRYKQHGTTSFYDDNVGCYLILHNNFALTKLKILDFKSFLIQSHLQFSFSNLHSCENIQKELNLIFFELDIFFSFAFFFCIFLGMNRNIAWKYWSGSSLNINALLASIDYYRCSLKLKIQRNYRNVCKTVTLFVFNH